MLFMLRKTGPRERKLLNFKRSSETFTQDTKAISNYIYVLYHSVIRFHSNLLYQLIGNKRNLWGSENLQSPFIYSNNTST